MASVGAVITIRSRRRRATYADGSLYSSREDEVQQPLTRLLKQVLVQKWRANCKVAENRGGTARLVCGLETSSLLSTYTTPVYDYERSILLRVNMMKFKTLTSHTTNRGDRHTDSVTDITLP